MVARLVRDQEVVSSNLVASTKIKGELWLSLYFVFTNSARDLRVEVIVRKVKSEKKGSRIIFQPP